MGIIYGKLILCHVISEGNVDKKISRREYNNWTVYNCFNNTFPVYCGSTDLNLPLITIDDRPLLHKRSRYTSDLIVDTISVVSKNSVSSLTNPFDSPQHLLLTYYDHNSHHAMNKYNSYHGRVKIGYCSSKQ